jgi:hypothetical protein
MSRDCHSPALQWVAEVTVTAGLTDLPPAVGFDELDDVAYLDAVRN